MERSLAGFTVGITGDRRWEEQSELLTRRGAQVVHGPVMATSLLDDADATLAATTAALAGPVDALVLTTGIGTRSWFGAAESSGLDDALRARLRGAVVLARGPKARSAAVGNGLDVHWQAPGETSAELVVHLAEQGVEGLRIVVQRDGGDDRLACAIAALGADVIDVPVYTWQRPQDTGPAVRLLEAAASARVHALTFTCSYAVGIAFEIAPDADALRNALAGPVRAVSVGPVTTAALHRHGVARVVEPGRARLGAMVQALVAELSGQHRLLRHRGIESRWQGDLLAGPHGEVTLSPGEARVLAELVARAPAVVPKCDLVDGADDHAAEAAVARLRGEAGPARARDPHGRSSRLLERARGRPRLSDRAGRIRRARAPVPRRPTPTRWPAPRRSQCAALPSTRTRGR